MRLLSVFVLLFTCSSLSAQLSWVTNPANGHRYALTGTMTWKQAEALAVAQGGHLVTVRSQAEQTWILQTFPPTRSATWCGFTDELREGVWVWSSGEPVTFTRWMSGEPNNLSNVEHYMQLNSRGTWIDNANIAVTRGIIEIARPLASYSMFGQACAGSAGTPQLTNLTLPKIGTTLQLQVTGLGASKPGALLVGFSDQIWQAVKLPFDLAVLGAPSCMMHIDPVVDLASWADSNGVASPVLVIPNLPSLFGLEFFNQYISLEAPQGRAFPITASNAGKGVIG